jgi:hypothetical protein
MASFAARRSPRAAWSVEESARFAALKEFALLRLLSTDRKAFATARRLGLSFSQLQSQPPSRSTAGGGATAAPSKPAAAAAPASAEPNASRRRSAARSAQHHAARRAKMCTRSMLSLLFIVRLRRLADGTLGINQEITTALSKRGPGDRPSSSLSCSSSSASSTLSSAGQPQESSAVGLSPVQHGRGRQEKKQKGGLLAGFLLG